MKRPYETRYFVDARKTKPITRGFPKREEGSIEGDARAVGADGLLRVQQGAVMQILVTIPDYPVTGENAAGEREREGVLRSLESALAGEFHGVMARVLDEEGVAAALDVARRFGGIGGEHHKNWVIDQMVRALTGPGYDEFVADAKAGEDGPDTYGWDVGIPP